MSQSSQTYAIVTEAQDWLLHLTIKRTSEAHEDVKKIYRRSLQILKNVFNNSMSNDMCFQRFRSRLRDIPRSAGAFAWTSQRTSRNFYHCNATTAFCSVLRKLAAPFYIHEMQTEFRMYYFALSEVFWESIEIFVSSK